MRILTTLFSGIILYTVTQSLGVLQLSWSDSRYCVNYPSTIFVFDSSQIQPVSYKFFHSESTAQEKEASDNYCYSSLDIKMSEVNSATFSNVNLDSYKKYLPEFLNSADYCLITGNSSFSYQNIYILPESCVFGLNCSANILRIQDNCLLNATIYSTLLLENAVNITTARFGKIRAEYIRISNATASKFKGYNYVPSLNLVYAWNSYDIANLSMTLTCMISFTILTAYFLNKFRIRRTNVSLMYACGQVLWMSYLVLVSISNFSTIPTSQLIIIDGVSGIVGILASFYSVLINAKVLIQVYTTNALAIQVFYYSALCFLHLALAGSYYLLFFIYLAPSSPAAIAISKWTPFTFYWIVFMFLFDTAPVLMCFYYAVRSRNGTTWLRVMTVFRHDKYTCFLALGTTINIVLYVTFEIAVNYVFDDETDPNYVGLVLSFVQVW